MLDIEEHWWWWWWRFIYRNSATAPLMLLHNINTAAYKYIQYRIFAPHTHTHTHRHPLPPRVCYHHHHQCVPMCVCVCVFSSTMIWLLNTYFNGTHVFASEEPRLMEHIRAASAGKGAVHVVVVLSHKGAAQPNHVYYLYREKPAATIQYTICQPYLLYIRNGHGRI